MARRKKKKYGIAIQLMIIIALIGLTIGSYYQEEIASFLDNLIPKSQSYTLDNIPEYYDKTYIYLNDNIPEFRDEDMSTTSFEEYSELDYLGRCGVALASIGQDLMPTKERESIGMIKPTGWHTVRYDGVVEGKYLYNRCHLIGYQLTGENANKQNLITCTRQMNTKDMVDFENKIANYIKKTNNHVMYRVTPYFEGTNLLATGVQMEAKSVEDNGKGISFNVFIYNIQDGIEIDYATGDSHLK